MSNKILHIVCLQVPYPLTIGANFDLYNKLKGLYNTGVEIHFHCFFKAEAEKTDALAKYCKTVQFYKRTRKFSFVQPYIVSSRENETLCNNLLKDTHPILLEGTHCTGIVFDARFKDRNIFVRTHNVEYLYYKGLAKSTGFGFKWLYYHWESYLLEKWEKKLAQKVSLITISQSDQEHFTKVLGAKNTTYLPIFYESDKKIPLGLGSFCLYHGNLSVIENEKAVEWLLKNVFNDIEVPFVIAGRNPTKYLENLCHVNLHTCIAANPSEKEMEDLVTKAQINVLPSINATGIKLKLLNALFSGRFCVTNMKGSMGFNEKDLFMHAEDALEMKKLIQAYFTTPFTEECAEKRSEILKRNYNLTANAQLLQEIIWP